MTKKARIAAAIAAPVVGSLAAIGFAVAPAAPAAGAATVVGPIIVGSNYIQIDLEPLLLVTLGHI